eukprot:CAMPEP_0184656890 /NCGR_PEP_ID=MMETSP0308-20130426/16824_1 /TAXON_ID=38269 /ORGANISM="Gloeochaete witrockiana, Strain SAG 46.84" /LENGTH=330 /DNA_ID=CAMNT_0027094203 /DNA_START=96 /DNA_END=1085 /DNA_ORIENTATION=-
MKLLNALTKMFFQRTRCPLAVQVDVDREHRQVPSSAKTSAEATSLQPPTKKHRGEHSAPVIEEQRSCHAHTSNEITPHIGPMDSQTTNGYPIGNTIALTREVDTTTTTTVDLLDDILGLIFARLAGRDIWRAACVCPRWRSVVRNTFVRLPVRFLGLPPESSPSSSSSQGPEPGPGPGLGPRPAAAAAFVFYCSRLNTICDVLPSLEEYVVDRFRVIIVEGRSKLRWHSEVDHLPSTCLISSLSPSPSLSLQPLELECFVRVLVGPTASFVIPLGSCISSLKECLAEEFGISSHQVDTSEIDAGIHHGIWQLKLTAQEVSLGNERGVRVG